MILRPPRSTRTDTLFPYTTLFRSKDKSQQIPSINGGIIYEAGTIGADRGDYNTTSNGPFEYEGDDKSITLNADLKAASGTFTLNGNYRKYGYFSSYDIDGTTKPCSTRRGPRDTNNTAARRSEERTSELESLMRD